MNNEAPNQTNYAMMPIKPRRIGYIADSDSIVRDSQHKMTATHSTSNLYHSQPKSIGSFNSTSNISYYTRTQNQFSSQFVNNNTNFHRIGEHSRDNLSNLNQNKIKTSCYRAVYDYDANDDDELTFRDGDKFFECEQIDQGWMIGVHEKTGKHGMFPSNYVEPIDFF